MKLCLLISWAHIKRGNGFRKVLPSLARSGARLMMDSGAFSAYMIGEPIDLKEYITAALDIGPLFHEYIQLDVIRNAERSFANLKEMFAAGCTPMGVLTSDAEESHFADLLALNKRVCVAGGGAHQEYYCARVERLWRAAGGDCGIHGLAFTRRLDGLVSRVTSVDSSTWMGAARWGSHVLFNRFAGLTKGVMVRELRKAGPRAASAELMTYLSRSGLSWAEMLSAEETKGTCSFMALTSVHATLQMARVYAQHGKQFFFAVPNASWLVPIGLVCRYGAGEFLDMREIRRVRADLLAEFNRDPESFVRWWAPFMEL